MKFSYTTPYETIYLLQKEKIAFTDFSFRIVLHYPHFTFYIDPLETNVGVEWTIRPVNLPLLNQPKTINGWPNP